MDWRGVYNAGANGINEKGWVPSFYRPTVSSLLHMIDNEAVMQEQDIREIFLNFMLHLSACRFTGIDLRPLGFSPEQCNVMFLCWMRCLMGFRASPYNTIWTYLIAEEIIQGNREDKIMRFSGIVSSLTSWALKDTVRTSHGFPSGAGTVPLLVILLSLWTISDWTERIIKG